ncbi:MAG: hypothetical protein IKK83_01200 [Clostridia bacterium]|nr:hypothetical protein [Clostridia bacterium]
MTDRDHPLRLCVLSPHGTLLDTAAKSVRLTAVDGSIGIHRGHPTALILLAHGKLSYMKNGAWAELDTNGVFAEVRDDTVTVIAE